MDLETLMKRNVFIILGDTIRTSKHAHFISKAMKEKAYTVYKLPKYYQTLNKIKHEIDALNLCISPYSRLKYLNDIGIEYIESCLLTGLRFYK